jgi:predicted nucleic acid-binding protein
MTFGDLVRGDSVFLDANIFVLHFQPHAILGPLCTDLLKRIEIQELSGYTSTHVLSEVAHRLMTMEASALFTWASKIVQRLQQSPAQVQQLTQFRSALQKIPQMRIQILTIATDMVDTAAGISQQFGLLRNDAMLVAVMRANGLTKLASHDAAFDRVPWLTRYAPA